MKKSYIIIFVAIFVILTTVMGFLGYIVNWWLLFGWIIFVLSCVIFFLLWRVFISKKSEIKEETKQIVSKEECLERLRRELLKPENAEMIKLINYNVVENYGTGAKSPINTICFEGEHEPSLIYYYITNMNKPELPTLMKINRGKKDIDKFEETDIERIKNMMAETPEKVKTITRRPVILETGATGIEETTEEISKEEAEKREEEKD